jgi:hypothetical protein
MVPLLSNRPARAQAGLAPEAIAGISFDATCSLVALDHDDRPAAVAPGGEDRWNVIVWLDHRAIAEAEECTATGHQVLDFGFFYVTRKSEQHMDFDLELAKSESKDNPIYYIQYAHARVCSVLRKLDEAGWSWDQAAGLANLGLLDTEHEKDLITKLGKYPEVLQGSALNYEPHVLANYLRELANDFHSYYNAHKMLIDDADLRNARVTLSTAVRQILANGLQLLGVSAPEQM